jgi:hypothetical protein
MKKEDHTPQVESSGQIPRGLGNCLFQAKRKTSFRPGSEKAQFS